ncbi:MAG: glycosyltransferase family 39 protein [Candidatus Woesearchaeota archaeon]
MRKPYLPIVIVLFVSLVVRLYFFFSYHDMWWDAAVYIGMGKYMLTLGHLGLWEPIRPVFWPLILGLLWSTRLNVVVLGNLVQLLMSIGIIYLVYAIAANAFDRRTAVLAAAIFSFGSIFFILGYHLYTEIPATFFLLLALFFLFRQSFFTSGLFFAFSVLTKFTMMVFIVPIIIFLFFNPRFRSFMFFGLGALVPLVPALAVNLWFYSSPFFPFLEANRVINQVLGCNVLSFKPWYFYLRMMISESALYVLLPIGFLISLRRRKREDLLICVSLVLPLVYLSTLHCRDYRYLLAFLPFASMLVGLALAFMLARLPERFFLLLVIMIAITGFVSAFSFYRLNEPSSEPAVARDFYRFLENRTAEHEIWVSNPIVALYADKKVNLVYYPVFDSNLIFSFNQYIRHHLANVSYVFLDSCGGGIICPPKDTACLSESDDLVRFLYNNSRLVYYSSSAGCADYVFFNQA